MKKSFHVFFLFTLIAFFATMANAQDAQEVNLEQDGTGEWFVNMPNELDDGYSYFTLTIPQNVKSFKLYDNGGKDGDYGYYGDGVNFEIIAPEGSSLELSGTVNTVDGDDVLLVNNGDIDNSDLVGEYCGENVTIGSIISSGNAFTLNFGTQGDDFASGFDLTITVVKGYEVAIAGAVGGTVTSSKANAKERDNVDLTVAPEAGYVLSGISVVAEGGTPVATSGCAQWYDCDNTVSFTMPAKGVTVTPVFTQSPSVNIPTDGSRLNVYVPTTTNTFKVHVGDYASTATGDLGLIAPEGFAFYVDGLNAAAMRNVLEVQDSTVFGKKCIWGAACQTDATIFPSYGSTVVLKLNTAEANFDLDLTVTLVSAGATKLRTISVADGIVGGSVTVTPEAYATYGAPVGSYVTLTATPAENYVLDHIAVVDSFGNALAIPATHWYAQEPVEFTMPATPVTVTPVFTNDFSGLSINMPEAAMSESETIVDVVLPEGVTSFKVYDGGGENAGSSVGTSGFLILRAPLGNIFEVTGNISTGQDLRLALKIYSGDLSGSPILETATPFPGGTTPVSVTSPGNVMTIGLGSIPFVIGPIESEGNMELTVTVTSVPSHEITLGDYTHGTIQLSKNEAYPGETITLTTSAESGYILADIEVLDEESNPVNVAGVEWSANNTATFVMPNGGVVVTPRFTNNPTAEGGLYRRMQSGWAEFIVPEGVKSFKLYAAQSDYCNPNRAVLSSADDRTFLIEGSISSEGRLYLGDGDIDDVDPGLQQASYYGFSSTTVGPYRSVKSAVKFDYGGPCEDVDFTVSLVKTTQYAAITVEEVGTTTTATINGSYTDAGEVVISSDIDVDTVVFNRNFTTGKYSTIMLPFSIKAGLVEGAEFYHLTGFEKVDGKWKTALISKVNDNDNLVANTPYLLEASETNLIFKPGGVPLTLNTTEKHPYTFESEDKSGYWEFRGTYEYIDYANDLPELLGRAYGFAAKEKNDYKVGDFAKLKTGAYTPAMRAYLVFNDGPKPQGGGSMTKSALGSGIPSDLPETLEVVIVNDEGKSIGGGTINTVTGQIRMNYWYDLQGRKLNNKPTTKGTYYHKGKLVIIK